MKHLGMMQRQGLLIHHLFELLTDPVYAPRLVLQGHHSFCQVRRECSTSLRECVWVGTCSFLKALQEAHEEDEHAFPFKYCVDLFEELSAVWCEETREKRRQLCARLGTENPRLEDLKLTALAPGPDGHPNFQFPRVWDLADSAGYYQKVILPRQDRAMARLLNKQLRDQVTREKRPDQRKTAGPEEGETPSGTPRDGARQEWSSTSVSSQAR